ncbi:MAG: hypothetical protein INR71_02965, partial [Terriglobus roseus]|nr:hypothetical protein [Terriglobus roseus]
MLSVPTNESAWSPRLKVYFKALNQYHARRRETPLGTLMVTNLSAFPSGLTCIPIPEGNPKAHREDFFVNEDLKRLGCSGRVGISLSKPTGATQAKFYQLYRASDKIDLYKAVVELVKLCQVALTLFDVLGPEYADGLLCDVTEKAINDWWVEIGNDIYNVEPHDGILGPTTVSALLGTLIGARNRLSAYGAQISKDVFDVNVTKRAIAYFQKSQRLPKTRRLDRTTLKKLHSATAKAATNEGWNVPRAVKSTVAELGGKGGEMVLETLGAKEKAGIADVETVDIEQFVELVRGERAKWLWFGKPRKSAHDMFNRLPTADGMVFTPDERGGYTWQGQRKDSTLRTPMTPGAMRSSLDPGGDGDDTADDDRKLTKRNTGPHEGKTGIGKFRNAVSLRGHHKGKQAKDDLDDGSPTRSASYHGMASAIHPNMRTDKFLKAGTVARDLNSDLVREDSHNDSDGNQSSVTAKHSTEISRSTDQMTARGKQDPPKPREAPPMALDTAFVYRPEVSPARTPTVGSSIEGSTYRGVDLDELFPLDDANEHVGKLLRRRHSAMLFEEQQIYKRNPDRLPRQVSFSAAEEGLLTWDTSFWDVDATGGADVDKATPEALAATHAKQLLAAEDAKRARGKLAFLDSVVGRWVDGCLGAIKGLEDLADQDMQELDALYYPRLEAYQGLRLESQEALAGERARLEEIVKDVEVLGAKLEYEI